MPKYLVSYFITGAEGMLTYEVEAESEAEAIEIAPTQGELTHEEISVTQTRFEHIELA